MKRTCIGFIIFSLLFSAEANGQQNSTNLSSVNLDDLSFFENPASNWKIVGTVSGSYNDTQPKVTKGAGVLLNDFDNKRQYDAKTNLYTKTMHGDMVLSMDFLMPKGSNSGIYFQGRYEVQLFDSWGVANPKSSDCGSIYERWDEARAGSKGYEGHAAPVNACLAPNLWQHLEVEFRAPRFNSQGKKTEPARFIKVVLNGVVLHENVFLYGPTRAAAFEDEKATGPLMIQGDHGPVAFRNIRYALLNDFSFKLSDLIYEYYEGKFNNDFAKVSSKDLVRSGKTEAIDAKLADNPNDMALVFKGSMTITDADTYNFTLIRRGAARLEVDGKEVIGYGDWFSSPTASVPLSKGSHSFVLTYVKNFGWAPGGLGLLFAKPNVRPIALHALTSLPPESPVPLIKVSPVKETEIVRSFMVHNGKKKTHVISVGDPAGTDYAYDLRQGSLLYGWRGDFLNTTEMWHERGEPQTATALGATVAFDGTAPFVPPSLPDTLDYNRDLRYLGYTLNESGQPVFKFRRTNVEFTDAIMPRRGGPGLTRTLQFDTPPGNDVIRLARDRKITRLSDNLYVVGDQRYFIQITGDPKSVSVQNSSDGFANMIMKADRSNKVEYTIIW